MRAAATMRPGGSSILALLVGVSVSVAHTHTHEPRAKDWNPDAFHDASFPPKENAHEWMTHSHHDRDYHKIPTKLKGESLYTKKSGKHKTVKGEALVNKFVQTLMNGEKYLRMIESVEKKINHLDAVFHEKTSSVQKYLSELLKILKSNPAEKSSAFRFLIKDLNDIKVTVLQHLQHLHHSSVDGPDFHTDPSLDNRLTLLESQIKNIMSGVESIVNIISEVKNRQFSRNYAKPAEGAGPPVDTIGLLNEFRKALHDSRKKCECKSGRVDRSERYPTDCHEIQMQGFNVSGIYKIKPEDMEAFYVLCDLTTAGGGWTVIQNRFDGSQDFYKGWNDYKNGFGNLAGEFWLGLEKLNYLTNQKLYELRVEVETQHGQEAYAGYSVFTVGSEHEGFRISTLGTYYGTAGDSLSYHAGQKFSTIDADNDEWKDGACAIEHGGAWWYKECDKSNLNGKYAMAADEHRGQSIYWISFKGPNFPLTKTKMMIRPLPASRPNDLASQSRKTLKDSKLTPAVDHQLSRFKELKRPYDITHKQQAPPYQQHLYEDHFFNYA